MASKAWVKFHNDPFLWPSTGSATSKSDVLACIRDESKAGRTLQTHRKQGVRRIPKRCRLLARLPTSNAGKNSQATGSLGQVLSCDFCIVSDSPGAMDELEPLDSTFVQEILSRPPFVNIPGVINVRDLGCLPSQTHQGSVTKPGYLFRSAELSSITEEGMLLNSAVGLFKTFFR